MKQVLIIGGGAAGLMAAISAARHGAKVIILEKMKDLGRKILITGKGRCNLTNNCDIPDLIKNMPGNGNFLYSAFYAFNNQDVIELFNQAGLPTKIERGGRVFPVSDQAKDVVKTLAKELAKLNVTVRVGQPVKRLIIENGQAVGAVTVDNEYRADAVIVATGGASYPGTGSSGDGYRLAQACGHTIEPLKPSLVPLEVEEEWVAELQGLSLKNVKATVLYNEKSCRRIWRNVIYALWIVGAYYPFPEQKSCRTSCRLSHSRSYHSN